MADPASDGVPPLVRLILVNALVGVFAGAAVATALVSSEGLGLGRLLAASSEPWLAAGLFFSGMMGTFGSLAAGAAIMLDAPSRRGD